MLWWGDTLSLLPWNHIWFVIIITPHLSLWGNGGRGQDGYITLGGVGGACQTWIIWNPFWCRNKKPTPSNVIGSMMIIRVLPIHVPRRFEPLITPHLSLWGNARTRATFPTHKKNHSPHPQGGEGKGVKMGTLHWGGVGGVPAKPGS